MSLPSYTLTLTFREIEVIGAALAEMPFKFADPLIQNIRAQMTAQEMAEKKEA